MIGIIVANAHFADVNLSYNKLNICNAFKFWKNIGKNQYYFQREWAQEILE